MIGDMPQTTHLLELDDHDDSQRHEIAGEVPTSAAREEVGAFAGSSARRPARSPHAPARVESSG
jgi:hypothetical protein